MSMPSAVSYTFGCSGTGGTASSGATGMPLANGTDCWAEASGARSKAEAISVRVFIVLGKSASRAVMVRQIRRRDARSLAQRPQRLQCRLAARQVVADRHGALVTRHGQQLEPDDMPVTAHRAVAALQRQCTNVAAGETLPPRGQAEPAL